MSIRLYEALKAKYENTKPIRGRAVDTRPWGDRRRDKELIVQTTRVLDGVTMYGARLHNTTVFEVDPKGTLTLRCDGWVTPTTSDFLHMVLREFNLGGACRRFNDMWVVLRNITNGKEWARVPRRGSIDIPHNPDTDTYTIPEQTAVKRTTDRAKMKELRAKAKGFTQYYRSLLKLSEGVVTAQFKADNVVCEAHENQWMRDYYTHLILDDYAQPYRLSVTNRMDIYRTDYQREMLFKALTEDNEENYAPLLTWFVTTAPARDHRVEEVTFSNGVKGNTATERVSVDTIDRMVTQILKEVGDAYEYKEVRVTEPMKDESKDY